MTTNRVAADNPRTLERIRAHYVIEKALAEKLRTAEPAERGRLYASLYEELFQCVPDHPQLVARDDAVARGITIRRHLALLRPYLAPQSVYLEIGAGDCRFAGEVARWVKHVYAVEVSPTIATQAESLSNFELVLSDGVSIPVPDGSVDIAFSNQLMEHLHPDDAMVQLANIHRALAPGGRYLCLTPNRLTGPHDVSRYFDRVATGFHLHEYTTVEISRLFQQTGFREVQVLVRLRQKYVRTTPSLLGGFELSLGLLPAGPRRAVARCIRPNIFNTIRIVGVKG